MSVRFSASSKAVSLPTIVTQSEAVQSLMVPERWSVGSVSNARTEGSTVQVGVHSEAWFLCRVEPWTMGCLSDQPELEGPWSSTSTVGIIPSCRAQR